MHRQTSSMFRSVAAAALLAVSACGGPSAAEVAIRETTAVVGAMNATLEDVIDLESARAARNDIARHQKRINALDSDAIESADSATAREIVMDPTLLPGLLEQMQTYIGHVNRLARADEIYDELKDVFTDLVDVRNRAARPR